MPRRPTPAYIRELKGLRPKVPTENQIQHSAIAPVPPSVLSTEALECWDRMVLVLANTGLITAVGRDKLARYCQAWADWCEVVQARNALGPKKLVVSESNWRRYVHWNKIVEMSERVMCDFEREYALTPAASARVRRPTGGDSPVDKMNSFIDSKPKPKNVTHDQEV